MHGEGKIHMFVLAAFATSALSARAAAGSVTTEAFVASVRPAIDALAAADALALSTSSGRRLRAFAQADAAEQEHAEAALDRWAEDQHRLAAKDAAAPTLDGLNQLTGLFAVPYGLVADATAIAGPPLTPLPAADLARAAARRELDRLATLGEPSFDAAYAADQAATLERLADTYDGFIRNGDDTTLRRLAVLALPRIRRLIDDLRRL